MNATAEKPTLIWEVPKGTEKKILADLISLALAHEELDEDATLLYLMSIEHWYYMLPAKIQRAVDNREIHRYNVFIEEVNGLPV